MLIGAFAIEAAILIGLAIGQVMWLLKGGAL
jgi:hypothetical protein